MICSTCQRDCATRLQCDCGQYHCPSCFEAHVCVVQAPPLWPHQQVEPHVEPDGQLRPLEDWRADMQAAREATIGSPGLYFDGSPTGAGKSYADIEAAAAAGKSLTLLATHEQCAELVAAMQARGLDAAAYPKMSPGRGEPGDPDYEPMTCQDFGEASKALAYGLSPTSTVCPGCWCSKAGECRYIEALADAKKADHAVACHARGAHKLVDLAKGKAYVAIHEDARNMLGPVIVCKSGFGEVAQVASEAKYAELEQFDPPARQDAAELAYFFGSVQDAAESLIELLATATETTPIVIRPEQPRPKHLDRKLFRAISRLSKVPPPDALQLCVGITTGEIESAIVQVTTYKVAGGAERVHRSIVGKWKTALPDNVPIIFGDATGSVEQLESLVGRPVEEITPAGRLALETPVLQVGRDITRQTFDKVVAGLLRGVLQLHPEAQRVGIIGHRPHVNYLDRHLDQTTRQRITRTAYFGQGAERSCNSWHEDCDLLIVLGTPRVPPHAVRLELLRRGQVEAAAREPAWGPRPREARTPEGEPIVIDGRGYAPGPWRDAHEGLVRAALVQCVGRGRPILDTGIPVVVISTERTLPEIAVTDTLVKISDRVVQVASTVEKLSTGPPIKTSAVAEAVGLRDRQTRALLQKATSAGFVGRVGKRGGWVPGSELSAESPKEHSLGKTADKQPDGQPPPEGSKSPEVLPACNAQAAPPPPEVSRSQSATLTEAQAERVAIMAIDGGLDPWEAENLAVVAADQDFGDEVGLLTARGVRDG